MSTDRTVLPITYTTIRIKRDLRLRHASFLAPLSTFVPMTDEVTNATTRLSRVLLLAVDADDKQRTRLHRRLRDQDEVVSCASANSRWLKSLLEDEKKR